jgi:hypothetical protein
MDAETSSALRIAGGIWQAELSMTEMNNEQ